MLTKEYRICLPMSVQEYRIAQLYMIQKKSREESQGAGSGVEILENEPYENGPGGKGQYTRKLYHIGSHLPGWFRAILPKSALRVEEEAWNAYPYTRTIYRCPFIEKFVLEIETRYKDEGGLNENIFDLSKAEMRNRIVDYLDIVKDPVSSSDYKKEEDPRCFSSEKTRRGPLSDNWREEYIQAMGNGEPNKCIMCAYKLCKVEFRYWGMQSKIEHFIHDIGLRKTMVGAHRQAWCWQDEYYGLTMDDIRRLERETQRALQQKMAHINGGVAQDDQADQEKDMPVENGVDEKPEQSLGVKHGNSHLSISSSADPARRVSWSSARSRASGSGRNLCDFSQSIEQLRTSSSDEDEFFDAQEDMHESPGEKPNSSLFRSSSMEMLGPDDDDTDFMLSRQNTEELASPLDRRLEQYKASHSVDGAPPPSPNPNTHTCRTTLLFIVLHGGSVMDSGTEHQPKHADVGTLKGTMEDVVKAHYPAMQGHIAQRLVACPSICVDTLNLMSGLNPYSFDSQSPCVDGPAITHENLPLGAIALFATGSPEYTDSVINTITRANSAYSEFLKSEEGLGFSGQVCLIGDCVGSMLGYDALCKNNPYLCSGGCSSYSSHGSLGEAEPDSEPDHHVSKKTNLETIKQVSLSNPDLTVTEPSIDGTVEDVCTHPPKRHHTTSSSSYTRHASCPNSRRTSTGSQPEVGKFDFEVTDFFMLGSPLALVLAYRRACHPVDKSHTMPRPSCHQMYNMFYPSDPSAVRLEPLLNERFRNIPPMKLPRYQRFPLGDGQSVHVVETVQSNAAILTDMGEPPQLVERRHSNMSISSQVSGQGEINVASISSVMGKWWGNKRLDYALYCPDALQNFPNTALPYLLHASFWESTDALAFILRQVVRQDYILDSAEGMKEPAEFRPSQPREKWLKRRTTIKLRNVTPNHRGNDVIVLEDRPQTLTAKFMYGLLDMVSLSGEKVDIHIMLAPSSGEWQYIDTAVSDSAGRTTYTFPPEKQLPQGMYPVKMVVRGDHTYADFYLSVLPPRTETVVFSIDGSFTASVSIMGKDPKVRAGAVDVVRHWQELGYLIIYITARPDMQHKKVVAWLAQHNFPHGMVTFMDGLSADPLRQKGNYLKQLVQEADIQIQAAYGSSKDITVYQAINMDPSRIFIVGKAAKKQHKDANILREGYAAHLSSLGSHSHSRPAQGNARLFIRKGCFRLPGQQKASHKRSLHKTVSLPQRGSMKEVSTKEAIAVSGSGNTVVEVGPSRAAQRPARGVSPRPILTS